MHRVLRVADFCSARAPRAEGESAIEGGRERDSPPSPPASGRESDGLARPAARRVTEPRENEREETRAGEPVDSRRRGATHARMHARTHILSTHRRSVLELEYLLLEEKKTVVVSRNSGLLSWDFLFVFGIDWF